MRVEFSRQLFGSDENTVFSSDTGSQDASCLPNDDGSIVSWNGPFNTCGVSASKTTWVYIFNLFLLWINPWITYEIEIVDINCPFQQKKLRHKKLSINAEFDDYLTIRTMELLIQNLANFFKLLLTTFIDQMAIFWLVSPKISGRGIRASDVKTNILNSLESLFSMFFKRSANIKFVSKKLCSNFIIIWSILFGQGWFKKPAND